MAPRRIPGEYDAVAWVSRDPDKLALAHGTPCSRTEAQELVAALAPKGVRVLFNATRRGSATTDHSTGAMRISLKKEPGAGFKGISVGLVLHEITHLLCKKGAGHGPDFVNQLDDLVAWWHERHTAAEAAAEQILWGDTTDGA